MTSLSLQGDEDKFDNNITEELRKEIEEKITYDGETEFHYHSDDLIECDIATRWNVPTDALREIAAKFRINIRAVGREDGVGFVQVVCVNETGEVIQDDEIGYSF